MPAAIHVDNLVHAPTQQSAYVQQLMSSSQLFQLHLLDFTSQFYDLKSRILRQFYGVFLQQITGIDNLVSHYSEKKNSVNKS